MDKRTRKIKMLNNQIRCQFSDEVVGHNPVVLVRNVILYLRKLGYIVSNYPFIIFLLFGILFFLPVVSAYDPQYAFDLSSRINIVISVCVLIGAVICFFSRIYLLSASLFVIMGILLLFNGMNVILSAIIIALGVVIAFKI